MCSSIQDTLQPNPDKVVDLLLIEHRVVTPESEVAESAVSREDERPELHLQDGTKTLSRFASNLLLTQKSLSMLSKPGKTLADYPCNTGEGDEIHDKCRKDNKGRWIDQPVHRILVRKSTNF